MSRVNVPALPAALIPSSPSPPPLFPQFLHPLCPGLFSLPLLLALGYPDSSMHPRFSVLSLLWGSSGFEGVYSVGVGLLVQEGKICLRSKCAVLAWSLGRIPQDSFCFSSQLALGWGLLALHMLVAAQFCDHRGKVCAAEAAQDTGTQVLASSSCVYLPALTLRMFGWSFHTGPQLSLTRMAWWRIL